MKKNKHEAPKKNSDNELLKNFIILFLLGFFILIFVKVVFL
jgi:hypothetical protein